MVESVEAARDRIPVLPGTAQTLHETANHKTYGYYVPDDSLRNTLNDKREWRWVISHTRRWSSPGRGLDVQGSVRFALSTSPR